MPKPLNIILRRGHGDKRNNLSAVKATSRALGFSATKPPFKIIHIAGTNGKGTTATLLATALKNAGHKTGLFISPHIKNVNERVQLNGKNISTAKLNACLARVLAAETKKLNFFEAMTLAAFLYFKESKAEYAVVECGIGGLKDSTNIFTPALSIITSIDLDHTDILGNTIAKIAAQKAGIIKRGVPCICGPLSASAKAVIKKEALKNKAPLKILPRAKNAFLQNAAIALSAAKIFGVTEAQFKLVLQNFKMPSRFEVKRIGNKYIIKDGAHNPQAIKEFIKTYKASPYCRADNTLIYGSRQDKDYKTAAKLLKPHFKNIALFAADKNQSAPPAQLAKLFPNHNVQILQNLTKNTLKKLSGNIIVVGSFYLTAKLPY